jgi:hypothetical protein
MHILRSSSQETTSPAAAAHPELDAAELEAEATEPVAQQPPVREGESSQLCRCQEPRPYADQECMLLYVSSDARRPDLFTPGLCAGLAALTAYASSTLASEASSEHTDAGVARDAVADTQPDDAAESGGNSHADPCVEGAHGRSAPSDGQQVDAEISVDSSGNACARVSPASRREDSPFETAPSAAGRYHLSPDEAVPPGLEELERTVETEASAQQGLADAPAAHAELSADAAVADKGLHNAPAVEVTGQKAVSVVMDSRESKAAGQITASKDTATVVTAPPLPVFGPLPRLLAAHPFVWPAALTAAGVGPPVVPVQGLPMLVRPAAVRSASHSAAATAETLAIIDKLIQYVKVCLIKPTNTWYISAGADTILLLKAMAVETLTVPRQVCCAFFACLTGCHRLAQADARWQLCCEDARLAVLR